MSNLQVSTRQHSGQRVLSQVVKVEVYKPLQIHPEYIYLTPGVSFVVITNDLLSSINLSQLYIYPLQDIYVFLGWHCQHAVARSLSFQFYLCEENYGS